MKQWSFRKDFSLLRSFVMLFFLFEVFVVSFFFVKLQKHGERNIKKLRLLHAQSHMCHAPKFEAALGVQCLFIFCFLCLCVESLLTAAIPFPFLPPLFFLTVFSRVPHISSQAPRALYLLNLPQTQKKNLCPISVMRRAASLLWVIVLK